ncbi:hypothetical protein C1701_15625 [Actinoalloteichus sp. AHMU CJ021]|nr:hypothetical protein C1701_15625 [Actinoalloteichus sp. AHMU CJ021]
MCGVRGRWRPVVCFYDGPQGTAHIEALTELSAAVRASARRIQAVDEQNVSAFGWLGGDEA